MTPEYTTLTARQIAFHDLMDWFPTGDIQFSRVSEFSSPKEFSFYKQLVSQVIRYRRRYDFLIEQMTEKKLKKLDREIIIALYIGLAQLDQMDRTAIHASVNETVNLLEGNRGAKGLINAVLRRFDREREEWLAELKKTPEVEQSFPGWLWKSWQEQWGLDKALLAMQNSNQLPEVSVVLKESEKGLVLQKLADGGFQWKPLPGLDNGLIISNPKGLFDTPFFLQGKLMVQDSASQRLCLLLNEYSGKRNLDICAAPGGKLFHLEWLGGNEMQWIGADISETRMKRLARNHARIGSNTRLLVMDALQPAFSNESFDLVLLDAPCSATGTIRKHPEIKWKRGPQDVSRDADLQKQFIQSAAKLVKPGGMLVYSTCSLQQEENEDVVEAFLKENSFKRESLNMNFLDSEMITEKGDYFCLPSTESMGLYGAFLRKN